MLAILVGTVQGGSQALSRSLFASMIPRERSSEFFGFFAVTERTAGILGPLTFAAAIALTGSSRGAILSVIAYFIIGALILSRVDIAAGQAAVERRLNVARRRRRPARRPSAGVLARPAGRRYQPRLPVAGCRLPDASRGAPTYCCCCCSCSSSVNSGTMSGSGAAQ